MTARFHAPGKVVVLGEYAVLDGAPALVAAVPWGVGCTWTPGPTRRSEAPVDTRFVDAALDDAEAPAGLWSFYDDPPLDLPSKPGLGGSAAATAVATFAALTARGGAPTAAETFHRSDAVHRRVQGSGSGIDVAASCFGGVLRFTRGATPTPTPPVPLVVVFSGQSARTGPRVAQYQAWTGRDAFLAASEALVDRFHADPPAALRDGRRLLGAMADAAGIAWRTDALDLLCDLAERHGGGAKPSGAGGGDCAIAAFPDPDRAAAYQRAVADLGFVVLSSDVSPGVRELTAPR